MDRYEALKHAVKAHGVTLDKCGQLYVLHPMAVADAIDRGPDFPNWTARAARYSAIERTVARESAAIVALLHDVREDTSYRLPALPRAQELALCAITRPNDESYADYISRVGSNALATIVKLADLWHNLQPERQDCLPEKEQFGLEKRYLEAREYLWLALGSEWWPA